MQNFGSPIAYKISSNSVSSSKKENICCWRYAIKKVFLIWMLKIWILFVVSNMIFILIKVILFFNLNSRDSNFDPLLLTNFETLYCIRTPHITHIFLYEHLLPTFSSSTLLSRLASKIFVIRGKFALSLEFRLAQLGKFFLMKGCKLESQKVRYEKQPDYLFFRSPRSSLAWNFLFYNQLHIYKTSILK